MSDIRKDKKLSERLVDYISYIIGIEIFLAMLPAFILGRFGIKVPIQAGKQLIVIMLAIWLTVPFTLGLFWLNMGLWGHRAWRLLGLIYLLVVLTHFMRSISEGSSAGSILVSSSTAVFLPIVVFYVGRFISARACGANTR